MVSKVRGPRGPTTATPVSAPEPSQPVDSTPEAGEPAKPSSGFSQIARNLLTSRQGSPLVSGALKIFGDNVILPANLTDPKNPSNDVKYLHLLSAVLGLDELERYFLTLDDQKHQAFLEKKEGRRQEILSEMRRRQEEEDGE
jgi:hypothetical protein